MIKKSSGKAKPVLQLSYDNKSNRMLSKSAMNTVTQITRRRQAIIEYSKNKGVTAAARRYNVSRQYIYRWRNRYNGTLESLKDRSHRPHSHPKQHTPEELKLIENMRKRNAHTGLVALWVKLRQKGYTRSITSLWRMLKKRNLMPVKPPNPKYVPKPYEKGFTWYSGIRIFKEQRLMHSLPTICIVTFVLMQYLHHFGRQFFVFPGFTTIFQVFVKSLTCHFQRFAAV